MKPKTWKWRRRRRNRRPRIIPLEIYQAAVGCVPGCAMCPHLYGRTCEFMFHAATGLFIRYRDLTREEKRAVRKFLKRQNWRSA